MNKMSLVFILLTACSILIGLINPISANQHSSNCHVKPGQSIQAAINSAQEGDTIIVEAGTYTEQLTISTSGITLVGHNAIIAPPPTPVTNTCSDLAGNNTQAGICITGSNVVLQDLKDFDGEHRKVISVGQRIRDISITGFTVTGFSGLGIAVVGARDAWVSENTLSSSSQYGVLTVGSKNSNINGNTVLSTPALFPPTYMYFIAICMDDVSTVTIANNDISGYAIGLCVETSGADIHDNNVHDVCVGAFVDPGINGAIIRNNEFSNTSLACPTGFASGITISGGINTVVKRNSFSYIHNTLGTAAAVVIVDGDNGEGASGNDVERNTFTHNDLDIYQQTNGTGNVVERNQCATSFPADLCQ